MLPTSEIVGRGAAYLALMDQQGMRKAESLDPKLRFWRAAMAVKNKAETTGCGRRRLMKGGSSCSFGPVRRRPGEAVGLHEQAGPPAPAPDVYRTMASVPDDQWEHERLEAEERRLAARKAELTVQHDAGRNMPEQWEHLMQARLVLDREKAELWQRRSTMEQRSERILSHRGLVRLATTRRAFQNGRLVLVTHRDEQGAYYFKSMSGALHAVHGKTVADEDVPAEWLERPAPIVVLPDEVVDDDSSSDISEMELKPNDYNNWSRRLVAGAAVLLLVGFLLLYL